MAKAIALVTFALGVLAIAAGNVQGSTYTPDGKFKPEFHPVKKCMVVGSVACATCVAGSPIADIKPLRSASFEIKCRSRKNGTVTFVKPALSGSSGVFTAYVEDGHHDDLCTVRAVASLDPRCNVKLPGFRSARITVFNYNPKVDDNMVPIEKPMFFLNNEALPNCGKARSKEGNLYFKWRT